MSSDVHNSCIIYRHNLVKIKSRKVLSTNIPALLASLSDLGFTLVLNGLH